MCVVQLMHLARRRVTSVMPKFEVGDRVQGVVSKVRDSTWVNVRYRGRENTVLYGTVTAHEGRSATVLWDVDKRETTRATRLLHALSTEPTLQLGTPLEASFPESIPSAFSTFESQIDFAPDSQATLPPDSPATLPPDSQTVAPPNPQATLPPDSQTVAPLHSQGTLSPDSQAVVPPNSQAPLPLDSQPIESHNGAASPAVSVEAFTPFCHPDSDSDDEIHTLSDHEMDENPGDHHRSVYWFCCDLCIICNLYSSDF